MNGRISNFPEIRESLKMEHRIVVSGKGVIPETDPFVKVGCYGSIGREYRRRITARRFIEPLLEIVGNDLRMTIFIEDAGSVLICVVQDHNCQCSGKGKYILGCDSLSNWGNFLMCVQEAARMAKTNREIIPS